MLFARCCGVVLLLVPGGCAATLAPPAEPSSPSAPVRALRFRQYIVESALEAMHGGGAWHDVLFLPDAGVVGTVVWKWRPTPTEPFATPPIMYARHTKLADEMAARPHGSDGLLPPEEITIDGSLARELVALADLTARQDELMLRLGAVAVSAGAVGGEQSVKAESLDDARRTASR